MLVKRFGKFYYYNGSIEMLFSEKPEEISQNIIFIGSQMKSTQFSELLTLQNRQQFQYV